MCLGVAGGADPACPSFSPTAASPSRGKGAQLFVYPRKKKHNPPQKNKPEKKPNPPPCFPQTPSQRQLSNFCPNTNHTFNFGRRQQHPAWKFSPQIIKIWQREKQLQTGLTQEYAIKITAGLLPALTGVINFRATGNAGSAFFFFTPFFFSLNKGQDTGSFLFNFY